MKPSVPGGSPLVWPVIMESHDEELKRHCKTLRVLLYELLTFWTSGCSHSFRASNPLYMISLLADRPRASRYPLMVDIDSIADVSNADFEQNLLYRLAESSASLAHAIMMVSASDLALRQVNKATSDRLVIYHKSRVLALLNEAIQDVQSSGSLETLATAAVLACHEVCQPYFSLRNFSPAAPDRQQLVVGDYKAWTVHILGFSRMIAINGGINSLERENPVRRLILWSDQVGALFMNMRPLFPASAVFASTTSHLTQTLSQSITKAYSRGGFEGVPSWLRLQAEGKLSENLLSVMEDIELVAFTGAQAIIEDIGISVETLVDWRDSVIHRLLYLAPESQDGDDEYSFEECARLAMILITLDRLFSPVLPGAYFQLTHMVADRLASLIVDRNLAEDWVAHEWAALWICFIGAGVSTNNPSTRSGFIGAGAPLCRVLFRGPEEMDRELEAGLRPYARVPTLHGSELFGAFVEDLKERISAL